MRWSFCFLNRKMFYKNLCHNEIIKEHEAKKKVRKVSWRCQVINKILLFVWILWLVSILKFIICLATWWFLQNIEVLYFKVFIYAFFHFNVCVAWFYDLLKVRIVLICFYIEVFSVIRNLPCTDFCLQSKIAYPIQLFHTQITTCSIAALTHITKWIKTTHMYDSIGLQETGPMWSSPD